MLAATVRVENAPKWVCFQVPSRKINALIPHSASVDVKTQCIQAFGRLSEHLAVSDCFSDAEIIFISHSVQLLFVSRRMHKDAVYFDRFLLSLPLFFCSLVSWRMA